MPLTQEILKQISENSVELNTLVLNDKEFNDKDLKLLAETLPKDSHISKIHISNHRLTPKSYPVLLDLVESHPNITLLSYKLIMPVKISASMYNGAITDILQRRIQEKEKKSEKLLSSKTDSTVQLEPDTSGKKQSILDSGIESTKKDDSSTLEVFSDTTAAPTSKRSVVDVALHAKLSDLILSEPNQSHKISGSVSPIAPLTFSPLLSHTPLMKEEGANVLKAPVSNHLQQNGQKVQAK